MKLVPYAVTRSIGRQVLTVKKNSPHIFFVGGVAGILGSTVLACKATLKLEKDLDEIRNDFHVVKSMRSEQTDQEHYLDMGYVYGKTARTIVRLYGPSIVLGAASITALAGSHIQLTRRNSALTATLALVSKAYEDYRVRVQDEVGEERELEIYRAIRKEELESDGKKKNIVQVTEPNGWSPYARFFDETCPAWKKDAELNRIFIECQQRYANYLLQTRGHVFLNDVYDMLGMERSQAGSVVGWVRDGDGDGYIDFGVFEAHNSRFVNGIERSVILDFNVDGIVYDKI